MKRESSCSDGRVGDGDLVERIGMWVGSAWWSGGVGGVGGFEK
jgi:hypothetical protein